jgi:hypothetical protein
MEEQDLNYVLQEDNVEDFIDACNRVMLSNFGKEDYFEKSDIAKQNCLEKFEGHRVRDVIGL